jgi:ssDNA-binding Zn-finger/Zn-ribbon topoisomerase 1
MARWKGFVVAPEGFRKCTRCGAEAEIRTRRRDGRRFLGCRNFPECKWTQPLPPTYCGPQYNTSAQHYDPVPPKPAMLEDLKGALKFHERSLHDPNLGQVQKLRIQERIADLKRKLGLASNQN